ncbi:TROVE domain-containing protein, partial [Streptomyces sp. NPDC127112]
VRGVRRSLDPGPAWWGPPVPPPPLNPGPPAAAVFGTALALRAERADLVQFGTGSKEVAYQRGESVLKVLDRFESLGGTNTAEAVRRHYRDHDRVLIVTDEQASYAYGGDPTALVPQEVPVYTWNLAGYQVGHAPSGSANRHTFGGLTDAAFRMVSLIEGGRDADWPWAAAA